MSFDKASKANQKVHKERSQLSSRKHLGFLEKKKDYKERAEDYHRKQKRLKVLKRRARDRNPDEFYFNMVRSKLVDGVHTQEEAPPQYTEDQLKLMMSQDIRYVNYKRSTELKKIEKLKGSLHQIGATDGRKNKHIIFCDSKKDAKTLAGGRHPQPDPESSGGVSDTTERTLLDLDDETLTELAKETTKKYRELERRRERERELRVTAQKMAVKNALLDKKRKKKKKMQNETIYNAAQYKWQPERMR